MSTNEQSRASTRQLRWALGLALVISGWLLTIGIFGVMQDADRNDQAVVIQGLLTQLDSKREVISELQQLAQALGDQALSSFQTAGLETGTRGKSCLEELVEDLQGLDTRGVDEIKAEQVRELVAALRLCSVSRTSREESRP